MRLPPISISFQLLGAAAIFLAGCQSLPNYGSRGAAFGGLAGAGTGAVVGEAVADNPIAGAAIGGLIGAVTGSAVGEGIDADMARNQAETQARLGRQLAGAVSPQDVITMNRAGLGEEVIATHIRTSGVAHSPTVNDLITLRNEGVSDNVIKALQTAPPPQTGNGYAAPPGPQPVVVQPGYVAAWGPPPPLYWQPPCYGPPRGPYWRPRPGFSWGFSFRD